MMDSFELNKIMGAILGTLLVLLSVNIVAGGIFSVHKPAKPGYDIAVTEAPTGAKAAAPEPEVPISQLLASASAEKGAAVAKKCQACHDLKKGGPNKVGPDLWDLIDRPVAEHEGFAYSAGMKEFSKGGTEKWTYDNINHFITSPKKFVKGTAMGFAGLPKDEDRANVIAYLRTLSDNPKPLPAPGAAADASAPAKPADAAAPAKPADGAAPAKPAAPAAPAAPAPAAPAK